MADTRAGGIGLGGILVIVGIVLAILLGHWWIGLIIALIGRVFFGEYPLAVSGMEALFIGLLCVFENNLASPFRFYYLLSLLCAALRHSRQVTGVTFLLHCVSYWLV